jgi:hypothetical protein
MGATMGMRYAVFATLAWTVALGSLVPVEAFAQPVPFYWDRRPPVCREPNQAKDPKCEIDDWPSFPETARRITALYQIQQFAILDRAMDEAIRSERQFADGTNPAAAVYWSFRQMMAGPGAPPSHKDSIAKWKAAVPDSPYAVFAQARYAYANAWNMRGNQYSGSVSKESWELFHIGLRDAEQILLDAPQRLKDTPLWHQLLLAVIGDLPDAQSSGKVVFEEATKRWPRYFPYYELALTRMTPKWGGTWELVDRSISDWSARVAGTERKSLYARLYASMLSQDTADEMAFDWRKLKDSFEDLIALYPSHYYKNLYASFACFARDKPSFSQAMRKITAQELDAGSWLPGHSYEACMRWAGV